MKLILILAGMFLTIILVVVLRDLSENPQYKLVYNTITKETKLLVKRRNRYTEFYLNSKMCCESLEKAKEYYKILMDGYEKQKTIDNSWIEIDRKDIDSFSTSTHKEWKTYRKYK